VAYTTILWDPDDDPGGNVVHLSEHDIGKSEVVEVFANPLGRAVSRSSGRPIVYGETSAGRLIAVVFEEIDSETVYPVTAFDVEP
jgi:hypothetical protein